MFEYNGYNFEPERKMKDSEKKDICTFSNHIKKDKELGMCDYDVEWKKHNYNYEEFYEASGDSQLDLFRCIENGKLYVPCEHELFEFEEIVDRDMVKKTLVEGFENERQSSFDLDDTYRIYCYIEDSNGFWDTYIHIAIDNNITREIDVLEDDCDMCDQVMFEEKIDKLIDRYEKELKIVSRPDFDNEKVVDDDIEFEKE